MEGYLHDLKRRLHVISKIICSGGRVVASPYARKLAADAGVDVGQASGSAPGGRIVAQDVQQLIESGGGKQGAPAQAKGAPASGGAPDGTTDVSTPARLPLHALLASPKMLQRLRNI